MMKFNMNEYIHIKITDHGWRVLEQDHDELWRDSNYNVTFEESKPKVDEDGYTKMQMWMVLSKFGKHMGLANEPVMDLEIIIPIEIEDLI